MKHTTKRLLSLLLVLAMLVGLFATVTAAAPADGAAITDLKVNNLTQPLGVDTTPVFRWLVTLDGYGRSQSAYQVIVASSAEKAAAHQGDLWDSGKVTGSDNFNVVYSGAALASRTPYYWTVQLWDEADASVGWSDVATFETGILDPSEWTAQWITSKQGTAESIDCDLNSANWIWSRYGQAQDGVPAQTMYFRSSFAVDAGKTVQQAVLGFTTDDYGSVYINGEKAGEVFNVSNGWQGGCAADITALVKTGINTVAADVTNGDVGYAGFIAKIIVSYTDGSTDTAVTDGSWKLTKAPAEGWQAETYDDSAWETPDQVLVYGSAPWGTQVNLKTKSSGETFSAPMLRKDFTVEKQVLRARAYVSGLGLFELKLNGQLPDDTVLNPAHTQYEDTVNYRVFDVTELVQQGENVLAAEVGNSFYNCLIQTWSWPDAVWRDYSKFMMELVLEYADGTRETIVTDPTWKAYSKGPITANDIYLGETYDARLEVPGWDRPGFDDSAWDAAILEDAPAGKLTFENMEPMRRVQSFTPAVTDKGNGTYILENPVMATGWARIAFDAPAGTEIEITYGETVNGSGYLNRVSMEGYTFQHDTYICKGVAGETYEPKFSYKGYRYIQVDGYPGTLTADDVTCYLIANDVDIIGSVDTSSEMINSLHTIMQRTMRNNMQGKPTDTPVWEKNGWTGDFNVSQRSFNYNFDTAAFTGKFQGDLRDSADSRGVVPLISPTADWGMQNSPVWNTVYINSLYEGWKSNGQFAQIEEHYDAMRKQANAYITDIQANGWVWGDNWLADWVAPDGDASASEGSGICGTAYVYRALEQMAEIADQMGKTEDAAEYRAAMEQIYAAFNKKFYNAQKGYYETTVWNDGGGLRTRFRQTSQLVPLAFGLCPEEYRESVVASLVDHIVNVKATHLDTGMVGTQLILPVLSQQGNADLALSILTQTTYPSWGYWLGRRNNTSTWEGYGDDSRSFNHYFLGTYEEWIFAYLGGIRDMTNGYETVVIDPYVNNQLTYSNISVDTIRGKLQSSWSIGETVQMEIIVPTGTTASIYLPAASADGVTVNGAALADQPGITAVTMESGKVKVTAGSGTYAFVMGTENIAASKAALRQVVGEAKRMNEDSYPEGTWARLTAALAEAENVLADTNATQAEVNAAAAALDAVLEETAQYRMGNLALGQLVTVSSTVDQGSGKSWDQSFLTDGVTTAASLTDQTPGWTSNESTDVDHGEYAAVDLGRTYKVSRVELYPAGQKGTVGSVSYGFPKDFTIEVSTDGTNWTPVVTETGYAAPVVETEGVNPVQIFAFDEVPARYICVRATSLNQLVHDNNLYRMQLAEIEVYNGVVDKTGLKALIARAGEAEEILYPADLWNRLQTAVAEAGTVLYNDQATQAEVDEAAAVLNGILDEMAAFQVKNLALNKPVAVSSSLDQSVGNAWHQKNLTDGDRKNVNQWGQFAGWTSNDSIEENHEEWAQVDLEQVYDITRVDLYPAGYMPTAGAVIYGFPKDFVIEVSVDGENWETARTVTDYPTLTVAEDNVPPVQRFTVDRINARYVRIRTTALHALVNDGNTYRMQLGEIEVYSYPETDAERAAAVDAKIRAIGDVTLDSKAAIDEARGAYDGLTDAQKALVTELPTLEAAEAAYEALLGKPVRLLVTGEAEAVAQAEAVRYTISAADMSRLATVKLTIALDPETLNDPTVTGAGDWFVIVQTYENGVLNVVAANKAGADGTGDLLTILAKPTGKAGTATVKITKAELCGYDGEGEKFVQADLTQASAATNLILNIYDVNRDGVVDLLDVARAQRHYGTDDAICDVNQDGEVNIADLILILNHFTEAF